MIWRGFPDAGPLQQSSLRPGPEPPSSHPAPSCRTAVHEAAVSWYLTVRRVGLRVREVGARWHESLYKCVATRHVPGAKLVFPFRCCIIDIAFCFLVRIPAVDLHYCFPGKILAFSIIITSCHLAHVSPILRFHLPQSSTPGRWTYSHSPLRALPLLSPLVPSPPQQKLRSPSNHPQNFHSKGTIKDSQYALPVARGVRPLGGLRQGPV